MGGITLSDMLDPAPHSVMSLFLICWTQPLIMLCHSFCYAGPSPPVCYITLSVMLDPAPHSVMSLFLLCWTQPPILLCHSF